MKKIKDVLERKEVEVVNMGELIRNHFIDLKSYEKENRRLLSMEFDEAEVCGNLVKIVKKSLTKQESSLYDCTGKLILKKKKSIMFLSEDLIRAEEFSGKYTLHDINGNKLIPFECSMIEILTDLNGRQYLRVERSEEEHGLYDLSVHPIIPCGNNYIYYNELAMGGPIKVKWDHNELISYLYDGMLRAI